MFDLNNYYLSIIYICIYKYIYKYKMRTSNSVNMSYYHYAVLTTVNNITTKKYYHTRYDIMDTYKISDTVIRNYLNKINYKSRKINDDIKIIKDTRLAYDLVPINNNIIITS